MWQEQDYKVLTCSRVCCTHYKNSCYSTCSYIAY